MDLVLQTWKSGGWVMIPLLILTVFAYYTAFELWIRLESHFLVRNQVYRMSDRQIAAQLDSSGSPIRDVLAGDAQSVADVNRHFVELANEYLPVIDRRIRFLGVIVTLGPLMGLLGTVTGMLSVFEGMIFGVGQKFQSIVHGISEALITTQTGLIISIPAMAVLSIIIQRRNRLRHSIARLERYNTCLVLRLGCPVPKQATPGEWAGGEVPV